MKRSYVELIDSDEDTENELALRSTAHTFQSNNQTDLIKRMKYCTPCSTPSDIHDHISNYTVQPIIHDDAFKPTIVHSIQQKSFQQFCQLQHCVDTREIIAKQADELCHLHTVLASERNFIRQERAQFAVFRTSILEQLAELQKQHQPPPCSVVPATNNQSIQYSHNLIVQSSQMVQQSNNVNHPQPNNQPIYYPSRSLHAQTGSRPIQLSSSDLFGTTDNLPNNQSINRSINQPVEHSNSLHFREVIDRPCQHSTQQPSNSSHVQMNQPFKPTNTAQCIQPNNRDNQSANNVPRHPVNDQTIKQPNNLQLVQVSTQTAHRSNKHQFASTHPSSISTQVNNPVLLLHPRDLHQSHGQSATAPPERAIVRPIHQSSGSEAHVSVVDLSNADVDAEQTAQVNHQRNNQAINQSVSGSVNQFRDLFDTNKPSDLSVLKTWLKMQRISEVAEVLQLMKLFITSDVVLVECFDSLFDTMTGHPIMAMAECLYKGNAAVVVNMALQTHTARLDVVRRALVLLSILSSDKAICKDLSSSISSDLIITVGHMYITVQPIVSVAVRVVDRLTATTDSPLHTNGVKMMQLRAAHQHFIQSKPDKPV